MIDGLEAALAPSGETPTPELRRALSEAVGSRPASVLRVRTFKRDVFERWLPARDLGRGCPAVLGRAAHPRGKFFWHVYEDVGDRTLVTDPPVDDDVAMVVDLLARLHVRFRNDPMLAEVRCWGGDLGLPFFATSVADALNGLRALRFRGIVAGSGREGLYRRLVEDVLEPLQSSLPARARIFDAHAGPDTLLHGDLWTTNAIVAEDGERACLIDWDHAGAGPATYDISTLLLRFPAAYRPRIVARYRAAVASEGGSVAPTAELNVLCETAELARYANQLSWLAIILLEEDSDWAWTEVEEVEGWFRDLGTVVDAEPGERA